LTKDELVLLIRKEVADRFEKDLDTIGEDTHFVNDLGADSLDMTEILVGVEDALDIRVQDQEIERLVTAGQVAEFLERYLQSIGYKGSESSS
jgi:acyl carrier protein